MASAPTWTLTQIGPRSWNFAWPIGFYNTVFTVTDEGVIALDPLNREAAAAYRAAIAQVTDRPIRFVVYSHDHLDHITGADVLAPGVPIVAHKDVPGLLPHRGFRDIPLPTILVDGLRTIELGGEQWELQYLGPNHGRTTLAVAQLQPVYGGWGAFEEWAPENVNRALIYLITGE